MTTVRDEAGHVLAAYDRSVRGRYAPPAPQLAAALRALLDEPITDAQVEAALRMFYGWPGGFGSNASKNMRAALEAARDADA